MGQNTDRRENRSAWDSAGPAGMPNIRRLIVIASLLSLVIAAALALFIARPVARTPPTATSAVPADSGQMRVEFERLKGKWVRPDGGYVLEIRRLLDQNALEAGYFNPAPIHVGKAKLYKERGFTKVFVELRDVNYPGSTYTLIYDPESDLLRGTYYQATQQQEYQIEFVRMPPGS